MKRNIKGAAQYQFSKMTGTDSTEVRKAIKTNLPYEAHSFKTGRANPSNYSYHHDQFVYSDAPVNASGIGSGGMKYVKGGDTALTSYNRYRANKKAAATNLKNLTAEFGSTAVGGIREEMVVGPKPEVKSDVKPKDFYITIDPDNTTKRGERVTSLKQGAAQGAYENPEIIQDADGAMAGANALSGVNEAIQIQSLKKPEDNDETDTETSGSPRIVTYLRNIK